MASAPRMADEGWPGWTKVFFVLGSLALVVLGIISVIGSQHTGGAVLGILCIAVGALYFFGLVVSPRWLDDPSKA